MALLHWQIPQETATLELALVYMCWASVNTIVAFRGNSSEVSILWASLTGEWVEGGVAEKFPTGYVEPCLHGLGCEKDEFAQMDLIK